MESEGKKESMEEMTVRGDGHLLLPGAEPRKEREKDALMLLSLQQHAIVWRNRSEQCCVVGF